MQSTPTESRGLRLPQALWQRIDSEADATGMSTNELLKRRLTVAFDFDSKVQKSSFAEDFHAMEIDLMQGRAVVVPAQHNGGEPIAD